MALLSPVLRAPEWNLPCLCPLPGQERRLLCGWQSLYWKNNNILSYNNNILYDSHDQHIFYRILHKYSVSQTFSSLFLLSAHTGVEIVCHHSSSVILYARKTLLQLSTEISKYQNSRMNEEFQLKQPAQIKPTVSFAECKNQSNLIHLLCEAITLSVDALHECRKTPGPPLGSPHNHLQGMSKY